MFNINEFIMSTLMGMIGNYPDFQIKEYALNWYEKGKISEEDLATIQEAINAHNTEIIIKESEEDKIIIEEEITEEE